MSHCIRSLLVVALLVLGGCGEEASRAGDSAPIPLSFAVWTLPDAPADSEALTEVLAHDGAYMVRHVASASEWMASDADVLVLRGPTGSDSTAPELDGFRPRVDFSRLKGRRVLGIGGGAGTIFRSLGLDIHDGGCAGLSSPVPAIQLGSGPSIPSTRAGGRVLVFPLEDALPDESFGCKAFHLPAKEALATQVEAVVRWEGDPDYAPITRQGNMIFCGIAAPVRTWSDEYRRLFGQIAVQLAESPLRPFRLSEWPVTGPGSYPLSLGPEGHADLASGKTFFFKFPRPVLLSAKLELETGQRVTLFFSGHSTARAMDLVDSESGETVSLLIPITERCLAANKGRYWMLRIINFGENRPARGTVRITYAPDETLRIADGTEVAMGNPPSDIPTIRRLIGYLKSEDQIVASRAAAALVMVGEPALPLLEAVGDPQLWSAVARIIQLITEKH